jgi:hypothetical protein
VLFGSNSRSNGTEDDIRFLGVRGEVFVIFSSICVSSLMDLMSMAARKGLYLPYFGDGVVSYTLLAQDEVRERLVRLTRLGHGSLVLRSSVHEIQT